MQRRRGGTTIIFSNNLYIYMQKKDQTSFNKAYINDVVSIFKVEKFNPGEFNDVMAQELFDIQSYQRDWDGQNMSVGSSIETAASQHLNKGATQIWIMIIQITAHFNSAWTKEILGHEQWEFIFCTWCLESNMNVATTTPRDILEDMSKNECSIIVQS